MNHTKCNAILLFLKQLSLILRAPSDIRSGYQSTEINIVLPENIVILLLLIFTRIFRLFENYKNIQD